MITPGMTDPVLDERVAGFEMDLFFIIEFEPYFTFCDVDKVDRRGRVKARLMRFHVGGTAREFLFEFLKRGFLVEIIGCGNGAWRNGKRDKSHAAGRREMIGAVRLDAGIRHFRNIVPAPKSMPAVARNRGRGPGFDRSITDHRASAVIVQARDYKTFFFNIVFHDVLRFLCDEYRNGVLQVQPKTRG